MRRDKKIDSMTKDLCHTETCEIKKIGIPCNHRCKAHIYATRAVDKGYAKASEVAREIFDEVGELINEYLDGRSYRHEFLTKIAELKKKYESEKDK